MNEAAIKFTLITNDDCPSIKPDDGVTVMWFVKASPFWSLIVYVCVNPIGDAGRVTAVADPDPLFTRSTVVVIVMDDPVVMTAPVGTTVTMKSRMSCGEID